MIREQKPLISNRDLINWAPLSQTVFCLYCCSSSAVIAKNRKKEYFARPDIALLCILYWIPAQISVICLIFHLCPHLLEILSTPPNIGKHIRVSTKNIRVSTKNIRVSTENPKAALARFFADEHTHYRKNI